MRSPVCGKPILALLFGRYSSMKDQNPMSNPNQNQNNPSPSLDPMYGDGVPPLPQYVADLETEAAFGQIHYQTAAEGEAAMLRRIEGLIGEMKGALAPGAPEWPGDLDFIRHLHEQLREARCRLAENRMQIEGGN
jgi:hypothetical protein